MQSRMINQMDDIWNQEQNLKTNITNVFSQDLSTNSQYTIHGFFNPSFKEGEAYKIDKIKILGMLQDPELELGQLYSYLLEKQKQSLPKEMASKINYIIGKINDAEPSIQNEHFDKIINGLDNEQKVAQNIFNYR